MGREKRKEKTRKGIDYRLSLSIPVLLLTFSIIFLVNGYLSTGEWFLRSIELKGGTLISLNLAEPTDTAGLEKMLSQRFGPVSVRGLRSLSGHGILIEAQEEIDTDAVLEFLKSQGIDTSQSSVESIGPALGESFWIQAQLGIATAFILMGIIVFFVFRTFIPSIAVVLAAFSDIIATLAFMQIFGMALTLAGLAALLMLIGYSIDTDILLTTRLLKTEGHIVGENVRSAFKTGITMSGTTIGALGALYISAVSPVLSQIAAVLLIGLVIDLVNTWLQNATILRWYIERRAL